MILKSLLAVLLGYLLGSFPSAYVASRIVKGRDIRQVDGGNMGTLNTLREIGLVPGLLVLITDVGKGVLAVLVAKWLGASEVVIFISGFAAVVGHSWPVFLGFKGGRGGATAVGIYFGLVPLAAAISFGVLLLVVLLTSNARLGLAANFTVQPFIIWAFGGSLALIIYALVVPLLLLGVRMLIDDHDKLSDSYVRKNLIIDHGYTWWQSRRKITSESDKKE